MKALRQNDLSPALNSQTSAAKAVFRVQLADIHPTKVLLAKDTFPDENVPPPAAHAKAFSQENNPVSISASPVVMYLNSSYALRARQPSKGR
jgi:hypothetical protein